MALPVSTVGSFPIAFATVVSAMFFTTVSVPPEAITVQVRSEEAAFLVLADAYYPGWTATIDDAPTLVYATNDLLRGVAVPPGEHIVTFAFTPSGWRNGLWLSGAGALILLLLSALLLLRRIRTRLQSDV